MKHLIPFFLIGIILSACNHSPQTANGGGDSAQAVRPADSSQAADGDAADTSHLFFPIADFIGGQLHRVDSLQLPLTKTVTIKGKPVLSALADAEFKQLAKAFRQPDINDPALKKFYKESNFADQSIPSIVFSYTTAEPGLEIRKAEVIIRPDPVKSDKVNTIYIEKERKAGDTLVREKLYWKVDHNFMIVREKQIGKTLLPAEQVKVVWDPTE
ncbi:MAG: hypothetical protein JST39_20985 [Bacteroidetes bacterium]|nr:hypothetical protein [Bacteroidota bacterium]